MLVKTASAHQLQLRVITFNVRYAATQLERGEDPWPKRLPLIVKQLRHEVRGHSGTSRSATSTINPGCIAAAVICLQEVLHHQLIKIMEALNKSCGNNAKKAEWTYYGVGRDDGDRSGEFNPIIYDKSRFATQAVATYWLSATPNVPSRGWDAGCNRILGIALLEETSSMRKILVANTHLDNVGRLSRQNSACLIIRLMRDWTALHGEGMPTVLTGDFNSKPDGQAYRTFQADGMFVDTYLEVGEGEKYGETETYSGFGPDTAPEERGRIDFIWSGARTLRSVRCGQSVLHQSSTIRRCEIEGYAVLPNKLENGRRWSDHRAVVADFFLT